MILLNERGCVAECTSANIFAVFGAEIATPPLTDGCLPGITREVLLEMKGSNVIERSLMPDDLYRADEVFITSTTRDLLPVAEIAGRALTCLPGARQRLSAAFREFVRGDIVLRRSASVRC